MNRRSVPTLGLAFAAALFCGSLAAQNLTDATGEAFPPGLKIARLVSIAPSLTEEVYALGADARLIGDTTYCLYPPAAKTKTRVGSMLSPNLEVIVSLHPDLVLATVEGNRLPTVQQLRRLGIRVFVTAESRSFADIAAHFRQLAALLGRADAAAAILGDASGRLARVQARVAAQPRIRVFYEIQQTPLVSVNHAGFLDEILRDAGAANVMAANPSRYPQLSREAVLQANPDAILISGDQASPTLAVDEWLRFPSLAAARSRRVFLVPSHEFSAPTPMTFPAAVEIAARLLHPEAR